MAAIRRVSAFSALVAIVSTMLAWQISATVGSRSPSAKAVIWSSAIAAAAFVLYRDISDVRRAPHGSVVSVIRRVPLTSAIIMVNVALFAVTAMQARTLLAGHVGDSSLARRFDLYPGAFAEGDWLRGLSAGFVHDGLLHLAVNMFSLACMAAVAELVLGRMRFLAVYVLALAGGAVAVQLFESRPVVGASGAVYGLAGAMVVILLRLHQRTTAMLGLIAVNLAISASVPWISWWCHLGGLVAGTLAAVVLTPKTLAAQYPSLDRLSGVSA